MTGRCLMILLVLCMIKSSSCQKNPDQDERKCGQRWHDQMIQPRIYGGSDTMPGEYPWNVFIKLPRGQFCAGSIISSNWVLTAGHCVLRNLYVRCNNAGSKVCRLIEPEMIHSITAGMVDLEDEDKQVRTATKIILHESFTSQAQYIDNDLALIRVNQSFVYNSRVNRICLPEHGTELLEGNQELHVTGWGKTDTSWSSPILQKVIVPHVSRDICNSELSYQGVVTETMFCAGYQEGGRDACQGDSGPLVYVGDEGRWVQGGITSWGRGCALENYYGVYTNLASFYAWVLEHIKKN